MTFNGWIIENWFVLPVLSAALVYFVMASKAHTLASIQELRDKGILPTKEQDRAFIEKLNQGHIQPRVESGIHSVPDETPE